MADWLTPRGRTVLGRGEMKDAPDTPIASFDDEVLLEPGAKLHRLAAGGKRDLQRNAVLPGLSDRLNTTILASITDISEVLYLDFWGLSLRMRRPPLAIML